MLAKGSSITEVILWMSIVVGAMILLWWYLDNFTAPTSALQKIDEDLRNISTLVNEACISGYYSVPYNLYLESGDLNWSGGKLCICTNCQMQGEVKQCRETFCKDKLLDAQKPIKIEEHTRIIVQATQVPVDADTNRVEVTIVEG